MYGADSNRGSICTISTVTGVAVYVIRNVFSRLRNTDSDKSSRSAAGKLFQTVGPLTVKLVTVVSCHAWNRKLVWCRSEALGSSLTRKTRPYNLYCVGADLKPCSINQSTRKTSLTPRPCSVIMHVNGLSIEMMYEVISCTWCRCCCFMIGQ